MAKPTNTQPSSKFFRAMEKKAAVSDAEKVRKATLKKTEKLRELRLAKEAEDRVAEAAKPAKKTKVANKNKLPASKIEV